MPQFWENIHFGRVVIWYGVKLMNIHFFKASIPPNSLYSINPFLLQHHPGGKYLVRQGIESIPSRKPHRRPLPSLLFLSFFYALHGHERQTKLGNNCCNICRAGGSVLDHKCVSQAENQGICPGKMNTGQESQGQSHQHFIIRGADLGLNNGQIKCM